MKKLMLTALAIFAFGGVSFAQTSADVTVSAKVIQALQLNATSASLDLGTVIAGTTPAAYTASTSGVPEITATANGATDLTVSYPASVSLSDGGSGHITFNLQVYSSSSNDPAGANTIADHATQKTSGSDLSSGNAYFWLGGSFAGQIPSNQTPGNYSGTFTFTVSY